MSILLWAKECIYEFLKQYHSTVIVFGANARRFKIYKWGLKDFTESSYKSKTTQVKFLYKVSSR